MAERETQPTVVPGCYVGVLSCGCAVAATVDRPEWKRDTARTIAEWIKDGLTVERWTVERVRADLGPCVHKTPPAEQVALL
jgi:hypothetical protein